MMLLDIRYTTEFEQAVREELRPSGEARTNVGANDTFFYEPETRLQSTISFKKAYDQNNFIDDKNIVDIPDEWLYDCPDFIHFDPKIDDSRILAMVTLSPPEIIGSFYHVPKRQADACLSSSSMSHEDVLTKNFSNVVRKWRTDKEGRLIKKKVFWVRTQNELIHTNFVVVAPDSEQSGLEAVFERYKSFDKHFFDDTTVFGNKWVIEFQLSFYRLKKDSEPCLLIADLKDTRISRGRLGFRINGDFFDRYWVCHIIGFGDENFKKADSNWNEELKNFWDDMKNPTKEPASDSTKGESSKRSWQQRKVLELILFDEIIADVIEGARVIFKQFRDIAITAKGTGTDDSPDDYGLGTLKDNLLFSQLDGKAYFSQSELWEAMQQVLGAVEDDLDEVFSKIMSWETREKDRGKERPRWTEKDERRYRPAIRKMMVSNA
ncbi:hypothetical protein SLS57_006840 [Botryosphaeria dothidea]